MARGDSGDEDARIAAAISEAARCCSSAEEGSRIPLAVVAKETPRKILGVRDLDFTIHRTFTFTFTAARRGQQRDRYHTQELCHSLIRSVRRGVAHKWRPAPRGTQSTLAETPREIARSRDAARGGRTEGGRLARPDTEPYKQRLA